MEANPNSIIYLLPETNLGMQRISKPYVCQLQARMPQL